MFEGEASLMSLKVCDETVKKSCCIKAVEFLSETGFMLLENLLAGHDRSCILDLKVGTRQYPDGASELKKERHIRRAMESTSSALGIRCCGMRVLQRNLYLFY